MGEILLIGSSGFLGSHFVHFLNGKGFDSTNIYHINNDNAEYINSKNKFKVDLNNFSGLCSVLKSVNPEYIVNFAGQISGSKLSQFVNTNFLGPLNLLECISSFDCNVKRIVLIGSAAEYGINKNFPLKEDASPLYINDYGFSKHLQKLLSKYILQRDGLPIVIARPFNIIGSGMSSSLAIGTFIDKIKKTPKNGVVKVGNLQAYRDYLDVEDVCTAIKKIMINGKNGSEYNICSGKKFKMQDILDMLISISGKKITVESKTPSNQEPDESYGDNSKLRDELDWGSEISLYDSLYKAYHNNKETTYGT